MSDSELLQQKLASVQRGAIAFLVLKIVFMVFGILMGVAAGLELLADHGWAEWGDAARNAMSAAGYLLIAWLSGRAYDAFIAIGALIREVGEIRVMAIVVRLDVMMARRKVSGMDLAERIGITQANLSKLKTGRAKAIRFSTLEAICRALDCQPGDLLEFDAQGNPM